MLSNDNEINPIKNVQKIVDDRVYEESLNTETPYHHRPKT